MRSVFRMKFKFTKPTTQSLRHPTTQLRTVQQPSRIVVATLYFILKNSTNYSLKVLFSISLYYNRESLMASRTFILKNIYNYILNCFFQFSIFDCLATEQIDKKHNTKNPTILSYQEQRKSNEKEKRIAAVFQSVI